MEPKHLDARGKGEVDYDYKNDILFFKVKDREYAKSLEFEEIVLDIDKEGFITGIQLFGASELFRIDKETLRNVRGWEFHIKAESNVITLQLRFEMIKRNKVIVEQGQNMVREATSPLADSEVLCKIEA